ncbi:hypothetical protein Tco_1095716 [Tanacetum coccineum]
MAVHTQPTLSPGLSDRLTEEMALSPSLFRKRYRSSYDTSSSSSSSPTLISRKRYRESEDAASEDQQHQAIQADDTAEDESLGLGYRVARCRALELARGLVTSTYKDLEDGKFYMDLECDMPLVHSPMQTLPSPVQIPSSPGWSLEPLLDSPVIASLVAPLVPVAAVGEDDFLGIGALLELHERAVREEIHSQCFRLRSLERAHKQAMITFGALWRLVLALETWVRHSDAQRAALNQEATVLTSYTSYPSRRYGVSAPGLHKKPRRYQDLYAEVILFYKGLDVPTRQILDSKGAIPSMNATNAKKTIQNMADYSQKWHNGTSTRARSTDTSDGLVVIQA